MGTVCDCADAGWTLMITPRGGEPVNATLLRAAVGFLSVSCRRRRPEPCPVPRALGASGRANAGWVMAQVEVRLLGPFGLATAEGPQRLPGHGERALLAVLALSAGRAVALPTLIEALWDPDHQPDDPVNALQVRASKVRRALAALGAGDVVDRQGAAYRLRIDPTQIDVHAFRDLIGTARRTGDPRHAVELYDKALALWRGEPLVDFVGPAWAGIEAAQLTELRLAAVGERAERLLTLGSYEKVVADLEPFVAASPTRERLVGQLMTALFNAGRQATALEVYARTRHALTEELGLDPSRELRTVMEQILRQDPAITGASPRTVRRGGADV